MLLSRERRSCFSTASTAGRLFTSSMIYNLELGQHSGEAMAFAVSTFLPVSL